jgi:predicted RNA-binding Zn-ribbon protein involved in translation (DUF1610 family)
MVLKCCVANCKSRGQKGRIILFSVPRSTKKLLLQQKWLDVLGRSRSSPNRNLRVCSAHFCELDFDVSIRFSVKKDLRLQPKAVPHLNLGIREDTACDYNIKMPNLECRGNIPKCGPGKIHNCKRCPYVTKAPFYMVNHAKRHRFPLESSRCERTNLEKYYCKDCNFETDLVVIFKQHHREFHRKDTDCVQDQPKNDIVVKSYICQKCSFETYSVLLWMKHLESSCFDTEDAIHWYNCDKCKYVTKYKSNIKQHKKIHLSADTLQCYSCDKCEFKTKWSSSIKRHKKIHLSADAIKNYSCDKCEFKTKRNGCLKQHKKNHMSADAVK